MVAALAVAAAKTGHVMADENAVAYLDAVYFPADFVDDSCGFVPQHTRRFGDTVPLYDVAAADAASHNFQQNFFVSDGWRRQLFYADIVVVVVDSDQHQNH